MSPVLWFIAGFLILASIAIIALTFLPSYRRATVRAMARSVGLAIPAGKQAAFEAASAARIRASVTGALIGSSLVLALLALNVIPANASSSFGGVAEIWFLVGGFYVGMSFGSTIRALVSRNPTPAGERYARPGAVDLHDYIAPIDVLGGRVAVAAGIGVLALASFFSAMNGSSAVSPLLSVGGIVVMLGVVSLAVFEVSSRRILERAQPAASPEDLAWNDAIRAMTVREIMTAPLSLGVWGSLAIALNVSDGTSRVGSIVLSILAALIAAGLLAAAVYSTATKPQQHYLRRLWPDVAARGEATASAIGAEVTPSVREASR
ncbi:MAG: hypothetical protein ACOH1T_09075 [Microbacteriaceae bacterium]